MVNIVFIVFYCLTSMVAFACLKMVGLSDVFKERSCVRLEISRTHYLCNALRFKVS